MSTKHLPWFRAYTEMVDDEKLRLLAFEDRWHFVAILCLKGQGVLDSDDPLLMRKVAVKLGIDVRTLEEVARRLAEVGLIDLGTLQPLAWNSRQMRSDSSAARTRAYRERMKRHGDVTVTAQEVDTDKEEEKDKDKTIPPAQAQAGEVAPPKAKRSTAKPQAIPLPPWLSADSWAMWDRFRKAKSARAWTHDAKLLSIRELSKLREAGHDPSAVIEQSIQRGWTGLFEIKQPMAASPASQSAAQRRSDWTADLNATIAKHTGTHQPEMQDLGVFDASGNRI